MTPAQDNASLEMWIDRTARMVGYRDEALDFLERAANQVPVFESDVGLVCQLWAVADQHDEIMCRAITEFDSTLFDSPGELDITRGVETRAISENESQVMFLCTWSVTRPEQQSVSCILYGEQSTGTLGLEVRDHYGVSQPAPFPIADPTELYKILSDSFFGLAAGL